MPLVLSHVEHKQIDLGESASISWSRVGERVRWVILAAVPVYLAGATIQPLEGGAPIVLDVPLGNKVSIGAAMIWVAYDDREKKFSLRIDGPVHMRAQRTGETLLAPALAEREQTQPIAVEATQVPLTAPAIAAVPRLPKVRKAVRA